MRACQQQHPQEVLHLAYFGSVAPELYGIRAAMLAPEERVQGTIVAGATSLSGQFLDDAGSYSWLWARQPQRVLDHSMWVFDTATK